MIIMPENIPEKGAAVQKDMETYAIAPYLLGGFRGKIVRPVKFCVGADYCKVGKQDTIKIGKEIDNRFMGIKIPNKMKIAVSGCQNSCAEPAVRNIGLIATKKGWNVLVGGTAGIKTRIGDLIAKNLSEDYVLDLISRIINYYKDNEEKKRLGRFIDKKGLKEFKEAIIDYTNVLVVH